MIGLVDYDLQTSNSSTLLVPNLEIMKIATYYRIDERQFCRLVNLDENDFSFYDKLFFFSESEKNVQVPKNFLRCKNLICGGTTFTKGKYLPFENEIIDFTIPRPTIYKEFLKDKYNDGIKTKVISHILDDSYYRMYAGDKLLPIPPIKLRKRVFLYDKDFFYPEWEEIIKELIDRKCSTIMRIHPIECTKISQYFCARSYPKLNRAIPYILNLQLPYKDIPYMLKHYKQSFLADITDGSNIYLPLGGSLNTPLQYANNIVYILNLLYSFWSERIKIKIKLIDPYIGYTNPFYDLGKQIEKWCNGTVKGYKTLYENIPKDKKYENIRESYNRLLRFYPEAINLFNKTFMQIEHGGRWSL